MRRQARRLEYIAAPDNGRFGDYARAVANNDLRGGDRVDIVQIILNYSLMETKQAVAIFEALSSDVRLGLFRLLVKHAPEGMVVGEIAKILKVTNTNLSFHLKGLLHIGLVSVEKEGRFWRYRANIPLMLETIAYLTEECCSGNTEQCRAYRAASSVATGFPPECACKKSE